MTSPTTTDSIGPALASIEGPLTVATAEKWRALLAARAAGATALVLDVSGVTDCDTLGLQVILSARATASRISIPFSVSGAHDRLLRTCAILGLPLDHPSTKEEQLP